MKKEDAEKEIDYQLVKLLLLNLQRAGLISDDEAEQARKNAQKLLSPIIGALDS